MQAGGGAVDDGDGRRDGRRDEERREGEKGCVWERDSLNGDGYGYF